MPPSSPGLQYLGTGALAHATFNGVIVASFSRSTLRSIRSSQARLQVHPELLGRTEVSRQTDRGVGGDASLSAHDLVDPPSGAPIDTERSFCVMPYLSMKSCIRNSPGVIGPMRRWPQARTSPVSTSSIGLDPSVATNGDGSATSHSSQSILSHSREHPTPHPRQQRSRRALSAARFRSRAGRYRSGKHHFDRHGARARIQRSVTGPHRRRRQEDHGARERVRRSRGHRPLTTSRWDTRSQ